MQGYSTEQVKRAMDACEVWALSPRTTPSSLWTHKQTKAGIHICRLDSLLCGRSRHRVTSAYLKKLAIASAKTETAHLGRLLIAFETCNSQLGRKPY